MTVLRRQNESRKWFLPLFVENCHFSPRPLSEKSGRHFSPILPLLGSQKKWRPQIPQIPSTFRAHNSRHIRQKESLKKSLKKSCPSNSRSKSPSNLGLCPSNFKLRDILPTPDTINWGPTCDTIFK